MSQRVIHNESQETKDFIVDWIDPHFFFSKKDVWHRFGMLGVFGDYVLSCTQGDIAEIGVGESSIYLGYLARKYHRNIFHCDVAAGKIINPLTIDGYLVKEGRNYEKNPQIELIDNSLFYIGPSNDFFKDVEMSKLALTFIDGDHLYEQVKIDFFNAVSRTVDNGYLILHDTCPPSEDYLREERCGTVYRLRQEIEKDDRFDCITLPVGCAISVGLTIVRKRAVKREHYQA